MTMPFNQPLTGARLYDWGKMSRKQQLEDGVEALNEALDCSLDIESEQIG